MAFRAGLVGRPAVVADAAGVARSVVGLLDRL